MKKVILINGLPGAGKDTMADYLVENNGYTKISFADELKNIICRTFDITREELDFYKNNPDEIKLWIKRNDTTIGVTNFRKLLQRFGTEGMKPTFGDDIWARLTYENILNMKHDKIVVPDFRFLVEYKYYPDMRINTVLIHDNRPLPKEGHSSDVELYVNNFRFNYSLVNKKDESFFIEINKLLKRI